MDQADSAPRVEPVHWQGKQTAVEGRTAKEESTKREPDQRVSALGRWKRLMSIIDQ